MNTYEHVSISLITKNQVLKIRPYVIKEEQIILMGLETFETEMKKGNMDPSFFDALIQIVKACIIQPESYNVEGMAYTDFVWVVAHLLRISKGDATDLMLTCLECKKTTNVTKDISSLLKIHNEIDFNKHPRGRKNIVKINDDMSYVLIPTSVKYTRRILFEDVKIKNTKLLNYDLVKNHIVAKFKKEERENLTTEEATKEIDKLSPKLLKSFIDWFKKEPLCILELEHKCGHCNYNIKIAEADVLSFLAF